MDEHIEETSCGVVNENVVLTLPIDLLVKAFNWKDSNYNQFTIKDREKFAEGVAEYLLEFIQDQETGLTVLQTTIDEIFDEMVCNAEDYIEELESDIE